MDANIEAAWTYCRDTGDRFTAHVLERVLEREPAFALKQRQKWEAVNPWAEQYVEGVQWQERLRFRNPDHLHINVSEARAYVGSRLFF